MIKKDTVFVLGAGASQAYGFPSGTGLVDRICAKLEDPASDHFRVLQEAAKCTEAEIKHFRRRLRESRLNSIDAFLQRRQEHSALGKCAIAQDLLACESETTLYPPPAKDWYRTLFNIILPNSPDEFRANRLKVITFNFDRSFEHALFRSLETLFDDASMTPDRNEPVRMLAMLPLLHLHGQLGALGWIPDAPFSRAYAPTNHPDAIAKRAEQS